MPLANLKFSSSKQSQNRVYDFPERENTFLYHQGEVYSIIQVSKMTLNAQFAISV
jgi:hypothetical protein